jgi:tRNA(fMet)-specific endonuclease VapC
VSKYLLDTNICIYFLKGQYELDVKIEEAGLENCYLSEITVAELKFGAENSTRKEENRKTVEAFIPKFTILPIYSCLDLCTGKGQAKEERSGN